MLLILTLVTIAAVVVVLVAYLGLILLSLRATRTHVAGIADDLEAVGVHTRPLAEKLTTINGGLGALLDVLRSADRHLGRAARVFKLS